jgi:putative oxidoreductase
LKELYTYFSQVLNSYRNVGLLIFRLGIGGMFMWHGFPKITGGIEKWTELGKTMEVFGIYFAPAFWGFSSGFAEFCGGLLIAVGLFYRLACLLLAINLSVAFTSQMAEGKGLFKSSQSIEDGFSFLGALFVGPGKYSIDEYLRLNELGSRADIEHERIISKS